MSETSPTPRAEPASRITALAVSSPARAAASTSWEPGACPRAASAPLAPRESASCASRETAVPEAYCSRHPLAVAAAGVAVSLDDHVTELGAHAARSADEEPAGHDRAADARSEREQDGVERARGRRRPTPLRGGRRSRRSRARSSGRGEPLRAASGSGSPANPGPMFGMAQTTPVAGSIGPGAPMPTPIGSWPSVPPAASRPARERGDRSDHGSGPREAFVGSSRRGEELPVLGDERPEELGAAEVDPDREPHGA